MAARVISRSPPAFPSSPSKKSSLPLFQETSSSAWRKPRRRRRRRRDAHLHVGHDRQEQGRRAVVPRARGEHARRDGALAVHRGRPSRARASRSSTCTGSASASLGALLTGFTLLLEERFDAARVVEAFAREGATAFMGVPTMYVRLLEHLDAHPEAPPRSGRRGLFTAGSAPLPAADFARLPREDRPRDPRALRHERDALHAVESVRRRAAARAPSGCPFPAARSDSSTTRDATRRTGELGEILVKGNGLMNGYWGREADRPRPRSGTAGS